MIKSKLTSKGQTTVPKPVRTALGLEEGDELFYEIDEDQVTVMKVREPGPEYDPFRTFTEWSSAEDEEAYADL